MSAQIDDGHARADFKGEGFEVSMDIGDSTSPYCNTVMRTTQVRVILTSQGKDCKS
ncbi:hypothetical protein RSAG8_07168, partial [Rhizoctonia solani AG-8 WAC10335]